MARPFHEVLIELDSGAVAAVLTEKLASLVQAVDEHQKAGTLTLTLAIKPNGAGKAMVDARVKSSPPEGSADTSMFFARPDGSLTRTSPRQDELAAAPAIRAAS